MARISVPVVKNLFLNFKRPMKGKIGLDIGTSSVKALMLTPQKQGSFELSFFIVEPIEGERSREKIVRAIKRAVEAAGVKAQKLVISVAGQAVVVRQVLFTKMSGEELRSAVQYEAEKHIPFSVNEVYLDARMVDEKVEGNKMKILLVAAKKELIDEHLAYINETGFEVDAIDSDSIAVTNAFIFNNPGLSKDKTIALINIGASMTNICILKNEILNFARDIPIEAKNFENLETQIRLSFDYYENQFGKGMDGIYISGGGSMEQGVAARLTQAFGIQALVWDPTKNLTVSPRVNIEALKEVSSQMAVCVGLALRQ